MMPHDASSMAGVSDLAIWNTWRGHAICALRACDPKVSIWRKKKNWTKSGKKGRKCGSLPSQHRLTASCSNPATKLFERQTCGCIYLWRLWQCHFVASCGCQCHSRRMKTVSGQRYVKCVYESLCHYYVTMYTSEISGSSSTNWGETVLPGTCGSGLEAGQRIDLSLRAHMKAGTCQNAVQTLFMKKKSFHFEEPSEYTVPHLDFSRNRLRHWNETWSAWQYHSTLLSLLHLSIVNLNMMATTCAITPSEHSTLQLIQQKLCRKCINSY